MDSSEPAILVSQQGTIASLTFNRPAVYNAMNEEMILAFRDAARELQGRPGVRALIVQGAGNAFIAGGDVALFHRRIEHIAREVKTLGDALHEGIIALRDAPFPVIARIQGAVAGAGFSLALACDFAIASERATFTSAYARIGVSPDGGSTFFLPRLVGLKRAAELIMLSETLTAARALEMGLVNRVVPAADLDAETLAFAERLARGPTQAYARAKRLLTRTFETPLRRQLDEEIACFAECAATADFREGVSAFVEKRTPDFAGR
jgi:2-(1,2-epoxy-1,2-dihydrophenyl)acetyl-CoA isomerase